MQDLVSVVIPTYNSAEVLGQALDSVVQQTYRPIEIITIDDCSVDDSYAIAKAYSQKTTDPEISFVNLKNEQNSGAGVTRNKGIKKASGRYIAFLDADDLWKPQKLDKQVTCLRETGAGVVFAAYEIFDQDPAKPYAIQQVPEKLTYDKLLKANYVGMLTGIYDTHKTGKVFMPRIRKRQDWAMWLDAVKKAGGATGINDVLASYRKGDGLSSNKFDLIKYNYAIYRQHLGYSALQSSVLMAGFLYEQLVVKKSFEKRLD